MEYFVEGFVTALGVLVVVLLVRYVKDGFRAGIQPENNFKE